MEGAPFKRLSHYWFMKRQMTDLTEKRIDVVGKLSNSVQNILYELDIIENDSSNLDEETKKRMKFIKEQMEQIRNYVNADRELI